MDFGFRPQEDELPVLQLQKWGPSEFPYKPFDFREGFISPTRKFLLLLSYNSEALLFPLVKDTQVVFDEDFNHQPEANLPTTSGSSNHISSFSESMKCNGDNHLESDVGYSGGVFVSDVETLAWGLCEDTVDKTKEASFRELLFVSGKHGVVVHALSRFDESNEATEPVQVSDTGQGTWVNWGTCSTSSPSSEVEEVDSTITVSAERSRGFHEEAPESGQVSGSPKRWFRTFLTKVETLRSDNRVYTRFPQRAFLPKSSAVSFTIFDQDSQFMDSIFCGSPSLDQVNGNLSVADPTINNSDVGVAQHSPTLEDIGESTSSRRGLKCLYKCYKVFSDSSHQLVGFAWSMLDSTPVNSSYVNDGNHIKVVIAVAKLVSWGIEWICFIKPSENSGRGPFECTDFAFSHRYLVCLCKSGFISLYGATSGAYIASLDVSNIKGAGPCINLQMSKNGDHVAHGTPKISSYQVGSLIDKKRKFKRLYTLPRSSTLGVMDECGVIFVIVIVDHDSKFQLPSEKVLHQQNYLDLDFLAPWAVGAMDIGCQGTVSAPKYMSQSPIQNSNYSFVGDFQYNKHLVNEGGETKFQWGQRRSHFTNSLASKQILNQEKSTCSDLPSYFMSRVILPLSGYDESDVICLSHFGITRLVERNILEKKGCQVAHASLLVDPCVNDEMKYNMHHWEMSSRAAVGCSTQGFLFLVTEEGLSVILPSISVPSHFYPVEAIGYRMINHQSSKTYAASNLMGIAQTKNLWSPWKVEILDRAILYEGTDVADELCLRNGWDLQVCRIRRLELGLDYLVFDEIASSLEMLIGLDLAVEGILRLLFAAVYLIIRKLSNDSELSAASRILSLATCFGTRMVRRYSVSRHKKVSVKRFEVVGNKAASPPLELTYREHDEEGMSRTVRELAQLLVAVRRLQGQLDAKFRRPGQAVVDKVGLLNSLATESPENTDNVPVTPEDAQSRDASDQRGSVLPESASDMSNTENLAIIPAEKISSDFQDLGGAVLSYDGGAFGKIPFILENPRDMIARWEVEDLDVRTVVKDALISGRLPLAVLRLHLQHSNNMLPGNESHDAFNDVRVVGRAIAYDLFLKGEIRLAITTLQKLGEDVEIALKQLVFGTVRRSLRVQVAEEMKRNSYFGLHELKMLDMVSLIERVYPCNSFFSTLATRRKEVGKASDEDEKPLGEISLHLLHPVFDDFTIVCGEIDGVVLGSWVNMNEQEVSPEIDQDSNHAAYWTAALAWSDAWDQRTIERVLLGQPFLMGVNILWESQLEYHVFHNDWLEVSKLLEVVPSYALSPGNLSISLDDVPSVSSVKYGQELLDNDSYTDFPQELDTVCMMVPGIRVLRFTAKPCSLWLKMLVEDQLAKQFIFLTDYWHGTSDLMLLLAHSGFIMNKNSPSVGDVSINPDAVQALHKVVVQFCSQYNLLNLLDMYLDFHKLGIDLKSLSYLLDAAGDNEWVKCLLLIRVEGQEYDASFSNARAIASHKLVPESRLAVLETDEFIQAVDDIAEGAGEMAALATLMFAPLPLQECLSSGIVNRHCGSAQCTLENLKPAIQRFPTVWNTLAVACFGQDSTRQNVNLALKVKGYSDMLDYLNWREGVFFSSVRDTSILNMIPYWFPKAVRRLIQLYVQGPIIGQSLADSETEELVRHIYYVGSSSGHSQITALSWEAAIQKHIEEELYAASLEGSKVGLEHHLHRGRTLAAFSHILLARVHSLKSENKHGQSESSASGPVNVQSDVQTLLGPITENEEPYISTVIPLAIERFDDTILVASCVMLLELCGLSASVLQIDVAALRRIHSFYNSADNNRYRQLSPRGSQFYPAPVEADFMESLARTLADDYLNNHSGKTTPNMSIGSQPSRALSLVLQHLEKASLPSLPNGATCGSWLLNGDGDGADLRSQQKASNQHWQLVTVFCQMHSIPLSIKYLAVLARDNDWVGFLSEAQFGKYPFETVLQVASEEFSDPRLKIHLLTVLKSMQSRNKTGPSTLSATEERVGTLSSDENHFTPVELFGIVAECERKERPGEALLLKAKNLRWSILALIASCFPDISALSCLTVWLEITAARETSAIKVNDIASHVAKNVEAAVKATNSLPATAKIVTLHYNRKSSKRRRLVGPIISVDSLATETSEISKVSDFSKIQGVTFEEEFGKISNQESTDFSTNFDSMANSLATMVSVLCDQHLFLPLLQAFEIFLPSCSLLPFIRSLQAFSQMRLQEASAHLGSFSSRIKEESLHVQPNWEVEEKVNISWTISTAIKAAEAMILRCPTPYEKKCLLKLLADTDFGDGGHTATRYGQLCWKIDLAEPSLRSDECPLLGNESLDDDSLLTALVKNGYWEQARNWAKQLEASDDSRWKSSTNHVTEMQAEAMVAEWKEFLWDVSEERASLWSHCQALFVRHSFPAIQAGQFFLKHAEAAEKDIPPWELHDILLLALQWLSGMLTQSNPVYPLHLLREIETRVWLLAVESEAQVKSEGEDLSYYPTREPGAGKGSNLIEHTAGIISKIDNHINGLRLKYSAKYDRENYMDSGFSTAGGSSKAKRRAKVFGTSKKPLPDVADKKFESEYLPLNLRDEPFSVDEKFKTDSLLSRWEERVGPAELERAVLSLLDFGQINAARQLQNKLSPDNTPAELVLVDVAIKLAGLSTPSNKMSLSMLDDEVCSVIQSYDLLTDPHVVDPLKALESLASILTEGRGHGLCRKIISVVKAANVLGLSFSEAFEKQPTELLQLLSLKAQESFEEAKLLVRTHTMPTAGIAQILAESFLKGLLAAHRGGYMDSQKEEGPAPLLWRFSDFLKWAELCPSDSEIGHALMRLVITGQEIPHECEVELLILCHHFYKLSACLDGVDVLVALAATRVEAYVWEGDFSCLARLITGVGNFHALNFILGILIENDQLELLLQKYSAAADASSSTAEAVRGFRMAVLTSLKQFNPNDLDAFAMVYSHFDMKHETASLLERRAKQSSDQWFLRYDKDQNEDLLESMRCYIEAAEVHSSIDAGNKTRKACAQASLVSLQIRMPDTRWLDLSETNARRILVDQSRFQEALIVAEAYGLNQPSEWALVLWEQMLNPELTEHFVAEFVSVLPLQPSMLVELARFYRAEVQARGDQSQFSVWLTGGGMPGDWAKYLGRSFRCLLKRTRDIRLKLYLATTATGFNDVVEACNGELDKVPESAGPLILRKGHGGAYLPLM